MADAEQPVIRLADVHDGDAVFELANLVATTFVVNRETFEHNFAAVTAAPDARLLVADFAGRICGYLLGFEHPCFFANGPVAWLEELGVATDVRRRGIASATTRARRLYEAIGYNRHAAYYRKII